MANIESCLNCLNDIDEQTLYAEGMVLSSHIMWSDKVSIVLEALQSTADTEDCEEFIQEAKSVGTGITVSKGDSLLKRVWDFIRRLVRSIINKISDVLTKLKIRNYEYIEIPMDKSLVEKDLDTIGDIYDKAMLTVFENMIKFKDGNDNARTDMNVINELIKRVSGLNILKGIDDGKRHGVKPNEFMALRDKIRYIDKGAREILKRTDTYAKKLESKNDSNNSKGNELEYVKRIQKLMTDMSNATTKLFASFKFGSINKNRKMDKEIDVKIKNLKKHVDELSSLINDDKKKNVNESYYDSEYIGIEDLEYIDETEKPYEAYLKNHKYDPKTNTIEIDGERRNAGKIPSNKERNRINKFLRENNYDPKTETIETDIKNKDGSYKRIKFDMDPLETDNAFYDPEKDTITMTPHGKDTGISSKPHKSNQTLKHEEGHAAQNAKDQKPKQEYSESKHKSDDNPVSTTKADLHKFMDDNPVDGYDHYQDFELDADLYGYQHNRYASKDMKTKNGLSYNIKDDNKRIENIDKSRKQITDRLMDDAKTMVRIRVERTLNIEKYDIERIIRDISELEEMLERSKKNGTLSTEDLHRFNDYFNTDIEDIHDPLSFTDVDPDTPVSIEDITKKLSEIKKKFERCKNIIEKAENDIKNMSINKFDDVDEYNEEVERINQKVSKGIEKAIEQIGLRHKEIDARNKFLDSHADEAGSQARKLEGRQGKHKGKK